MTKITKINSFNRRYYFCKKLGCVMGIEFPKLPYKKNALELVISQETLEYHYEKHHRGYFNALEKLIVGTSLDNKSLEEIIKSSEGDVFNNAAQVFNHTFYWNCMSPHKNRPDGEILKLINTSFGTLNDLKDAFIKHAVTLFGSGWCWLVQHKNTLLIENTSNAECIIRDGKRPLLICDVWEHAYYIDYRNDRRKYIENWWNIINWEFVNKNLE